MISKEQLKAYQNTTLCGVHQDAWQEILGTIDELLRENEELKKCIHCGVSGGELHTTDCWTFKLKKLERVAEAAEKEVYRKHQQVNSNCACAICESLQALRGKVQ